MKTTIKETPTGRLVKTEYPKGFFSHPFGELHVHHVTDWKKYYDFIDAMATMKD